LPFLPLPSPLLPPPTSLLLLLLFFLLLPPRCLDHHHARGGSRMRWPAWAPTPSLWACTRGSARPRWPPASCPSAPPPPRSSWPRPRRRGGVGRRSGQVPGVRRRAGRGGLRRGLPAGRPRRSVPPPGREAVGGRRARGRRGQRGAPLALRGGGRGGRVGGRPLLGQVLGPGLHRLQPLHLCGAVEPGPPAAPPQQPAPRGLGGRLACSRRASAPAVRGGLQAHGLRARGPLGRLRAPRRAQSRRGRRSYGPRLRRLDRDQGRRVDADGRRAHPAEPRQRPPPPTRGACAAAAGGRGAGRARRLRRLIEKAKGYQAGGTGGQRNAALVTASEALQAKGTPAAQSASRKRLSASAVGEITFSPVRGSIATAALSLATSIVLAAWVCSSGVHSDGGFGCFACRAIDVAFIAAGRVRPAFVDMMSWHSASKPFVAMMRAACAFHLRGALCAVPGPESSWRQLLKMSEESKGCEAQFTEGGGLIEERLGEAALVASGVSWPAVMAAAFAAKAAVDPAARAAAALSGEKFAEAQATREVAAAAASAAAGNGGGATCAEMGRAANGVSWLGVERRARLRSGFAGVESRATARCSGRSWASFAAYVLGLKSPVPGVTAPELDIALKRMWRGAAGTGVPRRKEGGGAGCFPGRASVYVKGRGPVRPLAAAASAPRIRALACTAELIGKCKKAEHRHLLFSPFVGHMHKEGGRPAMGSDGGEQPPARFAHLRGPRPRAGQGGGSRSVRFQAPRGSAVQTWGPRDGAPSAMETSTDARAKKASVNALAQKASASAGAPKTSAGVFATQASPSASAATPGMSRDAPRGRTWQWRRKLAMATRAELTDHDALARTPHCAPPLRNHAYASRRGRRERPPAWAPPVEGGAGARAGSPEAELTRAGICQCPLPAESVRAIGLLRRAFEGLDLEGLFALPHGAAVTVAPVARADEATEAPTEGRCGRGAADGESLRFVLTLSRPTQSMRWLCAGDSRALDAFERVAAPEVRRRLAAVAGCEVEVNAGCFIIVRDGVAHEECAPHYDFFSQAIPRGTAFTLMTPLSEQHPAHVGGLEFWPWAGPGLPHKSSDEAYRLCVGRLGKEPKARRPPPCPAGSPTGPAARGRRAAGAGVRLPVWLRGDTRGVAPRGAAPAAPGELRVRAHRALGARPREVRWRGEVPPREGAASRDDGAKDPP
ncbi:unnamed protein product, partial [Prorocentrum cordatum]